MAGRSGPDWLDFVDREERSVDADGNPVIVRVTAAPPPRYAPPGDPARLRMPGWSADPDAPVRRVEVKNRPEDPEKVARRRERLERELAAIEESKRLANMSDAERAMRSELAKLKASSS